MSCSFPRCNLRHLGGLWPGAGTVKTWRHQRCSSRTENRAGQPGAVHHAVLSGDGGLTASRFCFPIHCATHRKSEIIGDLESLQAPLILDINGEAGFCVQIALKTGCSFG